MPSTITMSYHLTHDEHHHHHGRRRSSKIIDVDQVSAQRERRRVMKKRFSSIFKPFYHHHHHHHDKEEQVQAVQHKGVAVRSPSPTEHPTESSDVVHRENHDNHDHDQQPALEHPIQTASSSSSSVSSTTTSSHSSDDMEIGIDRNMNAVLLDMDMDMDIGIDMNVVDVDELIEAGLALIELEQETTMVTLQTAEDPEEEEEEDEEEMEDIVEVSNEEEEVVVEEDQQHLTAQPTHNDRHYQEVEETEPQDTPSSTATSRPSLPPALLQEIQHHSHLDAVVEQAAGKQPPRLLPRALLDEIAHHSHLEGVVVVESSNSNNNTKNEDHDGEAKEEADVAMVPRQQQQQQNTDTDLMALKERCDNLATLTELLSKKLVESALCKKRDTVSKRHETKLYQEMIRRLEEQHRAECARMMADRKYLEGQLRYHKVESVPPPIKSKSVRFLTQKEQREEQEKAALIAGRKSRPRRRSFMDTLITPLERAHCHASPTTSTTSSSCGPSLFSPTSFSMASTIIWQNKLMPAMLSAVARAGAGAASPTPQPPQSTKSPSSSQQP